MTCNFISRYYEYGKYSDLIPQMTEWKVLRRLINVTRKLSANTYTFTTDQS
jgi:hypothetical protein